MSDLQQQVERFLFHEARLMDEHRYDEWLALWALDDATYWIPANADDIDPARNVSIVYDRRGQLRNRIQRFKETLWLKERAPRLKRIVGNIVIQGAGESASRGQNQDDRAGGTEQGARQRNEVERAQGAAESARRGHSQVSASGVPGSDSASRDQNQGAAESARRGQNKDAADVSVNSNFILAELHRGAQTLWAGTTIHLLTANADSFHIKSKKVILLNNNEPLPNMLFLF